MLTKLIFITNMIELTTGVLFLMSSLYGSGHADAHIENIANAHGAIVSEEVVSVNKSVTTIDSSLSNTAGSLESYLRITYADTPILVDVARCESNFHQFDKDGNLVRGIVNKADVGVMQINEKYHDESAKSMGLDLHTVEGNITYAKHLYEEQGTQPWSASSKCWSKSGDALAKK